METQTKVDVMEEFNARVEDMLQTYMPYVEELDGVRRLLLLDGLRDYCRVAVQLEDVNEKCIRTGTTIENVQGNLVKNPDLSTQHQLMNEKNALLPKLLKHLEVVDVQASDEMLDFIRGK